MDGIIRPHDDDFWITSAPLNGFRCRCRLISLSETQAERRSGKDKGKNKPIILDDMRPDKGFEYNPGQDLTRGIKQVTDAKPSSLLKEAMIDKMRKKAAEPKLADNILNNLLAVMTQRTFQDTWYSEKSYLNHLKKRTKKGDIIDATDYQIKTLDVIAGAESITIALPVEEGMVSGKLQIMKDGWIVLIGEEGKIITSYPFDPNKMTFEARYKENGDTVYEHLISEEIKQLLRRIRPSS